MKFSFFAPAKVNLCLLVGRADASGYHEVFTVFAPIALYDRLDFDLVAREAAPRQGELQVRCHAVEGEANLVARALRLLEQATGWCFSGRVTIDKRIPMSAGMGGGSTDAAAALRIGAQVLEASGGPVVDAGTLRGLARRLGADVPFFLDPRPAFGRGIGDLLEPLTLPSLVLVLVLSNHQLSTVEVYRTLDRMRGAEGRTLSTASDESEPKEKESCSSAAAFSVRAGEAEAAWRRVAALDDVVPLLMNDLEAVSFRLLPELARTKKSLVEAGVRGTVMTGSGPTLLGLCPDEEEATQVVRSLVYRRGVAADRVLVVKQAEAS